MEENTTPKEETTQEEMNVMPRIGDKAPDFEAMTTKGKINFPSFR